jgi:glycosyltransferase involved in cell wall biosynthesis
MGRDEAVTGEQRPSDRTGTRRSRILAVGMMPPPLGGQALMFETAVRSLEKVADVRVIDLQVQRNIGASGKLSIAKLIGLGRILSRAIILLARQRRFDTLYYCPSGPSEIGILKDIVLLGLLRPFCRRTVFHFHGTGGIARLLRMNRVVVALAKRTVWRPEIALRCAAVSPDDAELCESAETIIVPNGIADPLAQYQEGYCWKPPTRPVLTFLGAMTAEKGIFDLIEVARVLRDQHLDFEVRFVGEGTLAELAEFDMVVAKYELEANVRRLGVLSGREKFDMLANSSLFVFPSYFRAETQPLVVIEAFAMGVPAVAYDWRGLKTIIDNEKNGLLVEPHNVAELAETIRRLLLDSDLTAMSREARAKFEQNFTLSGFEERIRTILAPA